MAPSCTTMNSALSADGFDGLLSSAATCAMDFLGRDLSDASSNTSRRVSSSSSASATSGSDEECRNSTNVYVSELPPALTEDKFQELFAPFGIIISARLAPRRKGFLPVGFVQYTTPEAAQAAIAALDHKRVLGARISVRIARRNKDKGINSKPSITLYIANLPLHFTETDLRTLFSHYGAVRSTLVFRHSESGVSKGTALVRFMDLDSAMAAKEALHCTLVSGTERPLEVKYAESRHDKELRCEGRCPSIAEDRPATPSTDNSSVHSYGPDITISIDCPLAAPVDEPPVNHPTDDLAMRVLKNCLMFLATCPPPTTTQTAPQRALSPASPEASYSLFPECPQQVALLGGFLPDSSIF